MYICTEEILADINLAVGKPTAKPPNFPAIQCSQQGEVERKAMPQALDMLHLANK